MAKVAGYDCHGGISGICHWEVGWGDIVEGKEDYV